MIGSILNAFAISKALSGRPVIFSKVLFSFGVSFFGSSFFGSSFLGSSFANNFLTLSPKFYPSSIAPLKLLTFEETKSMNGLSLVLNASMIFLM